MKTYYFGLLKKGNGVNSRKISANTIILQVADSVDSLDCEIWKYLGARMNTLEGLKKVKDQLLLEINKSFQTNFKRLVIEKV